LFSELLLLEKETKQVQDLSSLVSLLMKIAY